MKTALPLAQAVLLWLRQESQGKTSQEYDRWLIERPVTSFPRIRVEREDVGAIQVAMKGQDPVRIHQAGRQAKMEADFRILLVFRTNSILPNAKNYTFQYDSFSGLVNKIVHPTGGYVRLVWGTNSLSDYSTYDESLNALICHNKHNTQAVTDRYVSFDGTTEVLHQHFAYTTTWVADPNFQAGQKWTQKTTTATTYDLVRATNFRTVYTYSPGSAGNQPQMTS